MHIVDLFMISGKINILKPLIQCLRLTLKLCYEYYTQDSPIASIIYNMRKLGISPRGNNRLPASVHSNRERERLNNCQYMREWVAPGTAKLGGREVAGARCGVRRAERRAGTRGGRGESGGVPAAGFIWHRSHGDGLQTSASLPRAGRAAVLISTGEVHRPTIPPLSPLDTSLSGAGYNYQSRHTIETSHGSFYLM